MTEADQNWHPVLRGVELGIGTWAWGDRLYWGFGRGYAESDLQAAFERCLEGGIRLFDTAETYGQGRSEAYLGEFLQASSEPVKIATKFMPLPWRLTRASLVRALRASLRRLGRSRVELYQIHWPFPPVRVETWMAAMVEAYQAGLIEAVGVSNFDRGQMQRAQDALTREGVTLASNQVEYSLLNRKVEKNGLLKQCQDSGVCLIAYSPIGSGVLSGKYTPENPVRGFRGTRYNARYLAQVQPLLRLMKKIGTEHGGKTPVQVAINWVICKGAMPIPGVKTISQAEQNLGALGWRLTDGEVSLLDEASDRVLENTIPSER
jgi:aryl-alcohol dehydrogenase-like predicted oxidoreductase